MLAAGQFHESRDAVADDLTHHEVGLGAFDALDREESCGAHFRAEHQDDGEARRDDANWAFASAWGTHGGDGRDLTFTRHAEPLTFESVHLATRSYA